MSDDNGKIDKESFEQMDKFFGSIFSKHFSSFDEMMKENKKLQGKCKHSPDLTKMLVVCRKCGVRMELGE